MAPYDEYDDEEYDEPSDEWRQGECDRCGSVGAPVYSVFGPIYCACEIGQGAPPEDCRCMTPAQFEAAEAAR